MGAMSLTRTVMLERFEARDAESDGKFLAGVLTTGIYCLPSCSAKRPKRENVRFFDDEDAARAAGLRACRRCRPDHFYKRYDPAVELANRLAEAVRRAPGDCADASALARLAGVGATKLTDLFRRHFHTTPAGFLQRERVEWAMAELTGTERRLVDVGVDAGWESASAFHENFKRLAGMTPERYRRLTRSDGFTLDLPADYRLEDTRRTLGRDAGSATERLVGNTFAKSLRLDGRGAVLEMELSAKRVRARVCSRKPPSPEAMRRAHAVALRLLGLTLDPGPFERRAARSRDLRRLIAPRPGLRISHTADAFEGLVWSIVGQQVNLAFAFTCRTRLIELAGRRVGGLRIHPTPRELARLEVDDLLPLQFSRRKAEYLIDSARAIAAGELDLEGLARRSAVEAERALLAVRGLGPWSTHYVMMRSFCLADCLPLGDAGLISALREFHGLEERPDARLTQALMEPFAPHRSLACFHLWKLLGDPA